MLAGLDACTRCTLTRFQWLPLRALAPTVSPIGRVSWTVLVILNLTFSAGKVSRATTRCLHHGNRSLTIDGDTVILLLFCNRHETLISPGCFILHVGLAVTKFQDHLSHPDGSRLAFASAEAHQCKLSSSSSSWYPPKSHSRHDPSRKRTSDCKSFSAASSKSNPLPDYSFTKPGGSALKPKWRMSRACLLSNTHLLPKICVENCSWARSDKLQSFQPDTGASCSPWHLHKSPADSGERSS